MGIKIKSWVGVLCLLANGFCIENAYPGHGDGSEATQRHSKKRGREDALQPLEGESSRKRPYQDEVFTEEHSLWDLLAKDSAENLVYQHPAIAMTAAQKIASWIVKGGVKEIPDPEFGNGTIQYYPLFSAGLPEAGGRMIVGQFEAIQNFVNYVFAAARGDGSAQKVLMMVGPAGTGKSYFLKILEEVAQTLTGGSPDHFVYTYEWQNLSKFPELVPALNTQRNADGSIYEFSFPCPINESPINLIPLSYVDAVYDMVKERIRNLTLFPNRKIGEGPRGLDLGAMAVRPHHYHCPQCQFIRKTILQSYMKDHQLSNMTSEQEVEALAPHVSVKRMIVGGNGTMATIDAESKDVNYDALFTTDNVIAAQTYGQTHPMSYLYSGKVLKANGALLVLDEYFRNHSSLRDLMLGVIQDKVVRRGGAPQVELDVLMVGATNKDSIKRAEESGDALAQIDRTHRVHMPYLINPILEAKNLLIQKNLKSVVMQKLGNSAENQSSQSDFDDKMESRPADINELFPMPSQRGQAPLGPDGRYNLWFADPSGETVHMSPNTLMFMAMTITGSRLIVNPEAALKFGPKAVVNDPAFRDRFIRLQILMKRYKGPNAASLNELRSLSRDLEEGDQGISERDAANIWLTQTIEEAKRSGNGNCITPPLAKKVFLRLLESKALKFPSETVMLEWKAIIEEMEKKFLIPTIQSDVSRALGSGLGVVKSMYDEIFQELEALHLNADSSYYIAANGDQRYINKDRLEEIRKIFFTQEHRAFSFQEVLLLSRPQGTEVDRHPGLLAAVTQYVAKRSTEMVTFDDIQRFSETNEGSSEVSQRAGSVLHVMKHEMGYCSHCAKVALMISRQASSQTNQAAKQ